MADEIKKPDLGGMPDMPGNEPGSAVGAEGKEDKGEQGGAKGAAGKLEDKLEKEAVEVGSKAIGVAATAAGGAVAGKAAEWLSKKVLPVLMKFQKKYTEALKKYGPWILLLNLVIIVMLFLMAYSFIISAIKGGRGLTANQQSSAYDSEDLANAQMILGAQKSLSDYESWYFNQGDDRWGSKPGQAAGWRVNSYRARACALTSASMIAKYYGLENVTPYIFGGYMAQKTGNMALSKDVWLQFLKENGINKKLVSVPMTIEAIRAEIAAGNPILAQGVRAFYASGQHWVVIVGVSDDGRYLILNDPSATMFRGKSGRASSAHELGNGRIKGLWALHNN